jgi:hypothetical protein
MDKYASEGLVAVGVQTPEFDFEGNLDNVRRAIKGMDVRYPVVVENDYTVWRAFDNHYWHASYFADAQAQIRHHHFGEGEHEESEMVLQILLRDAGADVEQGLVRIEPAGVEVAADWASLGSPESYVGYERALGFVSPGGVVPDEHHVYSAPSRRPAVRNRAPRPRSRGVRVHVRMTTTEEPSPCPRLERILP